MTHMNPEEVTNLAGLLVCSTSPFTGIGRLRFLRRVLNGCLFFFLSLIKKGRFNIELTETVKLIFLLGE